jgi:hypothetical protein
MNDPLFDHYGIKLKALWAVPALLQGLDLDALLTEALRVGSDADIALIQALIAAKPHLPERP